MVVHRCRFACARTTASDLFYTLLSTGNPFNVLYVWRQGASGGVRGTATDCGWNCDITNPIWICCVLRGKSSFAAFSSTYRYLLRFVCLGGGGGGGMVVFVSGDATCHWMRGVLLVSAADVWVLWRLLFGFCSHYQLHAVGPRGVHCCWCFCLYLASNPPLHALLCFCACNWCILCARLFSPWPG